MKLLFLIMATLCMGGCATNKPDYRPLEVSKSLSKITVYWPRQWQSQWGKYKIYANNKKIRTLKNEEYLEFEHSPGEIEIKSHHFQDKKFIVLMTVKTLPGKNYYFKVDTQPKEVTLMSAFDDITAVGTIVSGMKSELRLKEGKGSWKDAKNLINKEKAVAEMESKKQALGYHVLLPINEDEAITELKSCCRSKL